MSLKGSLVDWQKGPSVGVYCNNHPPPPTGLPSIGKLAGELGAKQRIGWLSKELGFQAGNLVAY